LARTRPLIALLSSSAKQRRICSLRSPMADLESRARCARSRSSRRSEKQIVRCAQDDSSDSSWLSGDGGRGATGPRDGGSAEVPVAVDRVHYHALDLPTAGRAAAVWAYLVRE